MSQQRIVIVGGGTAGWLAANHLARALQEFQDQSHITVTLIESPNIPSVGVGEGTVPSIRDSLHYFGISETELMRRCSTTFKQSIEFIDWQTRSNPDTPHRYQHVFDYPAIRASETLLDWIQHGYAHASFADTFTVQAHLISRGLAPKKFVQAEYQGTSNYAYHFDAAEFAHLLSENAVNNLGVIHRKVEIVEVVSGHSGIEYLLTESDEKIKADLYVDCSGARSLLLGVNLQTPFISKSSELFTDTALATQVQLDAPAGPIPCSTLATAHSAGWIWDIGLTQRRGVGIVYSSRHMTESDACATLEQYLGRASFKSLASAPRKIPMKSGYYQQFWNTNCVAIGMSQGFVEPLEATGLLMFDKSAQLLAQVLSNHAWQFEKLCHADNHAQQQFNHELRDVWEGVFDFIKLHYCLSKRDDSDFWKLHQDPSTWSPRLREQMSQWHQRIPTQQDLLPGVFNLANYFYVLYGMQAAPNVSSIASPRASKDSSASHYAEMQSTATQLAQELLTHRDLVNKIHTYGLQRI